MPALNSPAFAESGPAVISAAFITFTLALIAQAPSISNPGYFSFDELQWWARADVENLRQLPWMPWWDSDVLQLRPLTFNLWLLLAWAFADVPPAMHLAFAVIGAGNACLLMLCLTRFSAPAPVAIAAAVLFSLSPFATYTHGWTATLADLLVVCASLSAVLVVRAAIRPGAMDSAATSLIAVATLTALALLAKESAVVLPALLLAACWRARARSRAFAIIAVSSAVVFAYLVLRWNALTSIGVDDSAYAWSAWNVPRRALEYLLFPFVPGLFEIAPVLSKSMPRLVGATLILLGAWSALTHVDRRAGIAWIALYLALLAPVLVLGVAYNHYAYLASTVLFAVPALAWPCMPRIARAGVVVAAIVCTAHGLQVMMQMRAVGVIQQAFHEDLVEAVSASNGNPITIAPESPGDAWMLARFLHAVPSYRGTSLASVSPAAAHAGATTLTMQRDGRLKANDRAPADRD